MVFGEKRFSPRHYRASVKLYFCSIIVQLLEINESRLFHSQGNIQKKKVKGVFCNVGIKITHLKHSSHTRSRMILSFKNRFTSISPLGRSEVLLNSIDSQMEIISQSNYILV